MIRPPFHLDPFAPPSGEKPTGSVQIIPGHRFEPIHLWLLNERQGNVAIDIAGGANGTHSASRFTLEGFKASQSVGRGLTVSSLGSLALPEGTVFQAIKLEGSPSHKAMSFARNRPGNFAGDIGLYHDNTLDYFIQDGSRTRSLRVATDWPTGESFHLVTWDEADARAYLDGKLVDTDATSMPSGLPAHESNASLHIGAQGPEGSNYPFDGIVLYTGIIAKKLSAAEVADLYASPLQMVTSSQHAVRLHQVIAPAGGVTLAPADANHAHTVDAPTLSLAVDLAPADTNHAHTVDTPTLSLAVDLAPVDAAHAHNVDSPTLSLAVNLVPADSDHAHSADAVELTQAVVLVVADTDHGHLADGVALTLAGTLEPADAAHAHSADAVDLTQVVALVPADSDHAHSADAVDLKQAVALVVSNAAHAHTADGVVLDLSLTLAPADSAHAHSADGVTLAIDRLLEIADTLHNHSADAVDLTQDVVLIASDALHAHVAESPTLILGTLELPTGRVYMVRSQRRLRLVAPGRENHLIN